jgi:acyl transferase domain-containing protein
MVFVGLPEEQLLSYIEKLNPVLDGKVHVACVNSPRSCTLSGTRDALTELRHRFDSDGVFSTQLNTRVAYHSPSMQKIAPPYLKALGLVNTQDVIRPANTITMVSSSTGSLVSHDTLGTAQYWVDNLISPVRFSDAMSVLLTEKTSVTDVIEIGPHSALRRPFQEISDLLEDNQTRYHSVLSRSKPGTLTFLTLLGKLFCLGHAVPVVNADPQHQGHDGQPVRCLTNCPRYPFDHSQRYWSESRISQGYKQRKSVPKDSLGDQVYDWNPMEPRWRKLLSLDTVPWVGDHIVCSKSCP